MDFKTKFTIFFVLTPALKLTLTQTLGDVLDLIDVSKLKSIFNPRRHRGGGGVKLTSPLDSYSFKFFVPSPITKSFGTTFL